MLFLTVRQSWASRLCVLIYDLQRLIHTICEGTCRTPATGKANKAQGPYVGWLQGSQVLQGLCGGLFLGPWGGVGWNCGPLLNPGPWMLWTLALCSALCLSQAISHTNPFVFCVSWSFLWGVVLKGWGSCLPALLPQCPTGRTAKSQDAPLGTELCHLGERWHGKVKFPQCTCSCTFFSVGAPYWTPRTPQRYPYLWAFVQADASAVG